MRETTLWSVLLLAACGGAPNAAPSTAGDPETASASSPRETCEAIMLRTRECSDAFVPGLLALRVRLDLPPGIAARHAEVGEEALLPIAREEFERDWSDERIAANCAELAARPVEEQEAILAPERECMQVADCTAFVACDLANKERRWTAEAAAD